MTGVEPTMQFKAPLDIDYDNEKAEDILNKIMHAIEQTPEHNVLHDYDKEYQERKTREKRRVNLFFKFCLALFPGSFNFN